MSIRLKRLFPNLALALACISVVAVMAELILRVTYRVPARTMAKSVVTRTVTDEYDVEYATNSEGFRDVDHPVAKPVGTQRIAVLGDSFVFGSGVAVDETFVRRYQALLQRDGHRTEVMNFGVTGTGPVNMLRLWEQVVSRYEPDFVIITVYVGNDAADALRESREGRPRFVTVALARRGWNQLRRLIYNERPHVANQPAPSGWNAFGVDNPANQTALIAAARARGIPEDSVRARLAAIPDSLLADATAFRSNPFNVAEAVLDPDALRNNVLVQGEKLNAGWEQLDRALNQLIDEITESGARPALLCIPAGAQVDRRYWWATNLGVRLDQRMLDERPFEDKLIELAKNKRVMWWDPLGFMRNLRKEELYFAKDGHLTPSGHDLVARILNGYGSY